MKPLLAVLLLVGAALSGQEDPLASNQEIQVWARRNTMAQPGTHQKLQHLLTAIFAPVSETGLGLGLVYDNSRTRTVQEVWQERRANCLSLTAFYVAACRSVGIDAKYAEPNNTNRWRRVGNLVRHERHVVSMIQVPPLDDVVADFLPQLRRKMGTYVVAGITEARIRSMFYANRAVEVMADGEKDEALRLASLAIGADPTSAVGWNVRGVVYMTLGEFREAESAFRHAMVLDPKDGTPVGNMELLLRAQGLPEESLRYRTIGAELRKKDPYFHAFLAEEAMELGNWDEAQKEIKAALKIQSYEPEFHLLQARIHLQRGQVDAAVASLESARRWAVPSERERFDSKLATLRK